MSGPKPKYPIKLFDKEIAKLRQMVNSRKAAQGQVMRAKIILAAHEHPEWSNQEIARQAGCTDRAVRFWRRRWVTTKNLEDLPRPGAPKRFSPGGAGTSHSPGLQLTARGGEEAQSLEPGRDRGPVSGIGAGGRDSQQHP